VKRNSIRIPAVSQLDAIVTSLRERKRNGKPRGCSASCFFETRNFSALEARTALHAEVHVRAMERRVLCTQELFAAVSYGDLSVAGVC
jgi:hypothetical protein